MTTHYYLDWFYDKGFSEKLVNVLNEDITVRKSLVMISAETPDYKDELLNIDSAFERNWFNQANIFFDEYHLIDHRTQKEDAQRFIQNASVIFLCGGNPQHQKHLLTKNELSDLIKKSNAVVMGTSAGGMNMSNKYLDECTVYEGMALHYFSFEAHFDHDNKALIEERFPLSDTMDIYVAADQDGAVRVKDNKIDIIGNVYIISNSKIQKLVETL
ncbi:Type 1 glutamine amidotransferase-like domain-containing protein [Paenibacillus sp. EC2-1]|uniref:Type 1 glutamine amidotransferase-like domain-containing protein n=1 Tax=Paenibacillus sp. EC2-1 TaxID=3388665 RepID=UPI003BEF4892